MIRPSNAREHKNTGGAGEKEEKKTGEERKKPKKRRERKREGGKNRALAERERSADALAPVVFLRQRHIAPSYVIHY